MFERGLVLTVGWALLSLVIAQASLAQERPDSSRQVPDAPPDTTVPPNADSLGETGPETPPDSARPSSTPPTSSSGSTPSGAPSPDGQSNAVTFSAKDSLLIQNDSTGNDRGALHGEAEMSYQGASLRARTIDMNFRTGTLTASGSPSDTAQSARPIFQQSGGQGDSGGSMAGAGPSGGGSQSFTGDVLSYNLNTERGRVVSARTQRRDAFIDGEAVKMFEDSTLFVQGGSYSTCECPPGVAPSYSLRSNRMKVQGKWVYTGPIQLFLFNVPTPLFLPFGFLPNVEGRRSGPLAPQYGEDRRGFYLRDWGWYFALNPYTDLTIQASVWSRGSFEVRPRFRYRKRNQYNGDLNLTYRRERIGEEEDPNFQNRHEGEIQWGHSQDLSPTSRFSADVDLATSGDFSQRNSDTFDDAVRQDVSSNIRYRKNWPNGGRQFSISARQRQQLQSGEANLTLPNLNFSQNSFKPFRQEQRIGDEQWFEKITTSYQLDVQNTYSFDPRDPDRLREQGDSTLADSVARANVSWYEGLLDRQKYRLATGNDEQYDFQATHRIPLNMSFRVDRYNLTLSPNARYTSEWYLNTLRRVARRDSTGGVDEIVEQTVPGFYAQREFNTSFSASSEVYGTFPVQLGSFQGLRHRMSPSLSANYSPNFNAPMWGRTRPLRFEDGSLVPQDSLNQSRRYDILSGSPVRSSTEQWSLNFSLRNVFETKRVRVDTTGQEQTSKVKLLNLDVQGLSYNFAADSFRVGNNIGVNARTRIDPFNVSLRSSYSPYALERRSTDTDRSSFRRVDRLMISENPLTPARLTQFRFSLSADFSSENGGRGRTSMRSQRNRQRQGRAQGPPGSDRTRDTSSGESSPDRLSELSIPWSINLNFNYGFRKPQKEIQNQDATLGVDFSLNVTPLWRVQGNTGYDFIDKKMSTTRISINRNLGCWNMSFSWVPFGRYQQYGFNLQVSSGQLSQLLQLQIPNEGGEGRFGGFGDQIRNTASGAVGGGPAGGGGFP